MKNLKDDSKASPIIYFYLKNEEIRKANFEPNALKSLRDEFVNLLMSALEDERAEIRDYSEFVDGKYVIHRYDYDDEIDAIKQMSEVQNINRSFQPFHSKNDNPKDIKYILFLLRNESYSLLIFSSMAPVSIFKGRHNFFAFNDDEVIKQYDKALIQIKPKIDMFKFGYKLNDKNQDDLFILNVDSIEKRLNLPDIIFKRTQSYINDIVRIQILNDENLLRECLMDDLRLAKRLNAAMHNSHVLQYVPSDKIVDFVREHQNVCRLKCDNNKIKLTHKENVEQFINLINDNFLHSLLTGCNYLVSHKDQV